eukprot:scaffold55932_cov30-Tisochrysis_lutea.AAC.6
MQPKVPFPLPSRLKYKSTGAPTLRRVDLSHSWLQHSSSYSAPHTNSHHVGMPHHNNVTYNRLDSRLTDWSLRIEWEEAAGTEGKRRKERRKREWR